MDRRQEIRLDYRLACQVELNVQRFNGHVLNVSHRGLFVQTPAKVQKARNVLIAVEMLAIPSTVLTMQATVARQSWVPEILAASATDGLGLLIRSVPKDWLELLADLELRKRSVCSETMPPLRQVAPARCGLCGREHATLWSGICGWCSGMRPRQGGAMKPRW